VLPYVVHGRVAADAVAHVRQRATVPLWAPVPVPAGWLVSGLGYAGDERSGARATAFACSGRGPLGGAADLLLVAEEPGIGLGARLAGLPGPDPGAGFDLGPPAAKLEAAGHPTALWSVPSPADRAVFVGEAKACWLWAVLRPAEAGVLLCENLLLRDLREVPGEPEFDYGLPSELLHAGPEIPPAG
jgi:hypothetical protein